MGAIFRAHRQTVLLITIIFMFAVRPLFGDTGPGAVVFSLALVFVVLAALLTLHVEDMVGEREALIAQQRRWIVVGWALAIPAIVERVLMLFFPGRGLVLAGALSWFVLLSFVTWSQIRILLKQREVTSETISMSISIYLLLGLCWTLLYIVIFTRHPESFSLQLAPGVNEQHLFPIFVYFSLTCLSTIGFGDITPLTLASRYAAVAEGITGQFYLAIIVARLVSLQISAHGAGRSSAAEAERLSGSTDQPR